MSRNEADVSAEHFQWLVDGRSRNQKSTLDLYKIIENNEVKLNKNVEIQSAAQELTGIAFSLWRAVFLSDTTGKIEDQRADIKKFLINLISDNSVQYATDKNARNWSFRYYLDNAIFRFERLKTDSPDLIRDSTWAKSTESDKQEWINAQKGLEEAIASFEVFVDGIG